MHAGGGPSPLQTAGLQGRGSTGFERSEPHSPSALHTRGKGGRDHERNKPGLKACPRSQEHYAEKRNAQRREIVTSSPTQPCQGLSSDTEVILSSQLDPRRKDHQHHSAGPRIST